MPISSKNTNLTELEKILGITFKDRSLLTTALTHRSFLNETKGVNLISNERMEFLGDSVLSFLVSRQIYHKFTNLPEGKLTFIRTYLVRTETLALVSEKLSLGKFMQMSKGEELGGGRENTLLLANCFEAVLGSIYLDQGVDVASKFLESNLNPYLELVTDPEALKDSKSLLQEKVQSEGLASPEYKLISSSGPDHQKLFVMGVFVTGKLLAKGSDNSKQKAEEKAAKFGLELYTKK